MQAANRFPVVVCPGCGKAMQPTVTASGSADLHTTTYRCERCDTHTERIHQGRMPGGDERR